METTETLEAFSKRMSEVEYEKQYIVGRAYSGHTRTIYSFENQRCWLESRGYRTIPNQVKQATPAQMYYVATAEPYDYWVHSRTIYGKGRAKKIANHYHGEINEEPYTPEEGKWFYLTFNTFEDLMQMVYDIHTGKYAEVFGKEKEYESCIPA